MNRKNDNILNLLRHFQSTIDNLPPVEKMYEEVRMMNFKIRPLQGDIALLDLNNTRLIEVLWKLGRLDEFFQKEFDRLNPRQKEVFVNFFDGMHSKFQQQLGKLSLKNEQLPKETPFFEMEIFRERPINKKPN
jgi:hypothetical protein